MSKIIILTDKKKFTKSIVVPFFPSVYKIPMFEYIPIDLNTTYAQNIWDKAMTEINFYPVGDIQDVEGTLIAHYKEV